MKKLFFALALVLLPASAWAGGCGCGSVRAIVTAAKSETIQAVNAHTAAEAQAIRSEILLAAQNIIGTLKAESATIVRALIGAGRGGRSHENRGHVRQGSATRRAVRK